MTEPMEQLKSLLGIWYTDSPTWPPAPGVRAAVELLEQGERQHAESLAVYIGRIKELTGELMAARELEARYLVKSEEHCVSADDVYEVAQAVWEAASRQSSFCEVVVQEGAV